jgi:hypothetical protein
MHVMIGVGFPQMLRKPTPYPVRCEHCDWGASASGTGGGVRRPRSGRHLPVRRTAYLRCLRSYRPP